MTVAEFAKEYSRTPQAVYQRLKSIKERHPDVVFIVSDELTEQGEAILRTVYGRNADQKKQDALQSALEQAESKAQSLSERVKQLEADLVKAQEDSKTAADQHREAMAALQVKLDALQLEYNREHEANIAVSAQYGMMKGMYDSLQQQLVAKLEPAQSERDRLPWYRRLFGRK